MAVVNPMNPIMNPNVKDSRWLTLEVCREYQRNKCTRTENECKFAHPPAHVEVQNGRVIACFDSIKGKCQRKDPPCKYLHPPQHLREQLLQNGRNNLILRSLQMQAYHPQMIAPSIIPVGQIPYLTPHYLGTVPTSAVAQLGPYGLPAMAAVQSGAATADGTTLVTSQIPGVISSAPVSAAKGPPSRPDRLELTHCLSDCGGEAGCDVPLLDTSYLAASHQVCREFQRGTCSRQPSECRYAHPTENVSVDCSENQPQVVEVVAQSKKRLRDSAEELVLPPYVIPPYKRLAVDGSTLGGKAGGGGLPAAVYHHPQAHPHHQPAAAAALPASATATAAAAAAYQQATLMQLQQQPSYPLTYSSDVMSAAYTNYLPQDFDGCQQHVYPFYTDFDGCQPHVYPLYTVAGHPPTVPRF
ncbi:muscleblind-like protein 1 isoform X14 [Babylonia areolata]|uniref:muscleblind-like protein 1 isoform X14 n=1 Tax=Babylonia areolata TaxID=304850 RepID=UPI003FD1FF18